MASQKNYKKAELPKYTSYSNNTTEETKEEKSEKLNLFLKKEEYEITGMCINNEELEGKCEITFPDEKKASRNKRVEERPSMIPLVADRRNYEKTMHRASSDSFEFNIAQDAALSNLFSSDSKKSTADLFSEFEEKYDPNNNEPSQNPNNLTSRYNGHEPGWDGENSHTLPAAKGPNHYIKFGFPGFVPCSNQTNLPKPGYTRVITSSLWIGNVSFSVTEEMLRLKLTPFGSIETLSVIPGNGYGFVRYLQRSSAEKALKSLQGLNFGKSQEEALKVRWAKGSGIEKDNFTYIDGVSYVASSDIEALKIPAEDLLVDETILGILGERAVRSRRKRSRSRDRDRGAGRKRRRKNERAAEKPKYTKKR